MAEENSTIATENDVDSSGTGNDEGQSSSSSNTTGSESIVSAERYYYDEGCGYVDSKTGDPLMHNGKYVTTKQQLEDAVGQNANAKTSVQNQSVKPQPVQDNGPVFGKFDPVKSTGYFKTLMQKNTGYNSQLKAPPQPIQENAQQQNQPTTEQQVDLYDQVQSYKTNLVNHFLEPLQIAAQAMQDAGTWTTDNPKAVELNQRIQEQTGKINELAKKRELDIFQKLINGSKEKDETAKNTKETEAAIQQARFNVGKDYGGEDGLDWLLAGKPIVDAQGNQKFVRGPGADLVEALVDVIYDGKNDVNTKDAYATTWNKMQKNQQVLSILAYYASAAWIAQNIQENNSRVRDETLKAERARNRNNIQKPQGMNQVSQGTDGMPQELSKFLGLSTV